MLIECSLSSVKTFFEQQMLSCSIEEGEGEGEEAIDYLLIDMGEDEKNRPQVVEVFLVHKVMSETDNSKSEENRNLPNFLHIQYVLPFEFLEDSVNDIARFLLLINKTLEFSGFGMSEVDRMVYFRHDLYCDGSKVNSETLKALLGYVLLIVDIFSPTIETLGLRELTFEQVVEEALRHE